VFSSFPEAFLGFFGLCSRFYAVYQLGISYGVRKVVLLRGLGAILR